MIKVDCHTHTNHSHDGHVSVADMAKLAREKGLYYLCTTDHCDYDLVYGGCKAPFRWGDTDVESYYQDWKRVKEALDQDKTNTLTLGFGIEAAYADGELVAEKYQELISKYPFDTVINSVHCAGGKDMYFKNAYLFKSKKKAYGMYLDTIRRSLDVPYQYDVVAHIGYVSHGAPYRDKTLRYVDFADKIDDILKRIIELDKALEVNFHHEMNPKRDIIERYYALGGRKISYGSDAHRGDILKEFESVSNMLKQIGFTEYVVYVKHEPHFVPIGD